MPVALSRSLRRRWLVVALVVALAAPVLMPVRAQAANTYGISFLADSVLIGAQDELRAEFSDLGASVSGFPGIYTAEGANIIDRQPHLVGDIAVVSLGHNFPGWDVDRFDASVDAVMQSLRRAGARQVIWVSLRHPTPQNTDPTDYFLSQAYVPFYPNVNAALHRALNRHPDLTIADWTSLSHGTQYNSDAMHLNDLGEAAYIALLRRTVTNLQTQQRAGSVLRIPVTTRAGVPDDAHAALVRVTADQQRNFGRVTAYPCDRPRPATSLFPAHHSSEEVSNLALVALGPGGDLCVHTTDGTQLSVDLQGWVTDDSDILLAPRPLVSAIDVAPGAVRTITLADRFKDAAALAVNVTARGRSSTGGVTVHTCGRSPRRVDRQAFSPNIGSAEFRIVRPSPSGTICVTSTAPATVSVDLQAAIPGSNEVGLLDPTLLLNTTVDADLQRIDLDNIAGLPPRASGAALTIQVRDPAQAGSVRIRSCARPGLPSREATFAAGENRTTTMIVPFNGDLCVRSTTSVTIAIRASAWLNNHAAGLHLTHPVELWRTHRLTQRLNDGDFGQPRVGAVDEGFGNQPGSLPGIG